MGFAGFLVLFQQDLQMYGGEVVVVFTSGVRVLQRQPQISFKFEQPEINIVFKQPQIKFSFNEPGD